MAKPHKHESQSVTISTRLTGAQLETLARRATDKRKTSASAAVLSGVTHGVQKVEVSGAGPAAILLQISSPLSRDLMSFTFNLKQVSGRTQLQSEIGRYRTTKQTVMFIPVTPATMVAFDAYKAYCRQFASLVKEEDPEASVASTMW